MREVANVHVSAAQSKRGVVFQHEITEGPASRSYGIDVAKLAGIPSTVIRRAKAFMTSLEKRDAARSAIQPDLFEEGSFLTEASSQLALEEPQPPEEQVETLSPRAESAIALQDRLADLDPTLLSARDAMMLLYELHDAAELERRKALKSDE